MEEDGMIKKERDWAVTRASIIFDKSKFIIPRNNEMDRIVSWTW